MLSLNTVSITSSDSQTLEEIYTKLLGASIGSDIGNMHSYVNDRTKFLSLFFDGSDTNYSDFGIEWAYVESCEKSGDEILAKLYSYNGNLSIWKVELEKKYKDRFSNPPFVQKFINLNVSLFVEKSVRFNNYEVEKNWTEAELPIPVSRKK
jgi:hypothetical protein